MFKIDLHVHTSEVSWCGRLKGADTVRAYKKAGYDGIVITDHYRKDVLDRIDCPSWDEKIEKYLAGYYNALACGKEEGLIVLPGMELTLTESPNDYLVFGVDEQVLKSLPELYLCTPQELRKITKDNGLIIFQAHPFRPFMYPQVPELLDGIEVYNGNPRHNSRNKMALKYAQKNKLRFSSGSDCHETEDIALGGVILPEPVTTPEELVNALMTEQVQLIRNGESHNK